MDREASRGGGDGGPVGQDADEVDALVEVVRATGHEHVAAAHDSTVEVTTDDWLTPAGDCIVGVAADRAPADFDADFVAACRDADNRIVATFEAGGHRDRIVGRGHPDLTFDSDRSAVGRTSTFVDDRTVFVGADGAATDLDRDLTAALAGGADLRFSLRVER